MGNFTFFLVVLNCMLVSTILWILTFFGSYLYKPKQDLNREVHFECGFFSINKNIPSYNLNFLISAIFLILYDIELILLIPVFFNFYVLTSEIIVNFLIFILSVIFSLLIDVETSTIKWFIN